MYDLYVVFDINFNIVEEEEEPCEWLENREAFYKALESPLK